MNHVFWHKLCEVQSPWEQVKLKQLNGKDSGDICGDTTTAEKTFPASLTLVSLPEGAHKRARGAQRTTSKHPRR